MKPFRKKCAVEHIDPFTGQYVYNLTVFRLINASMALITILEVKISDKHFEESS